MNDPSLASSVENPAAPALSEVPGAELLTALLESARAHPTLSAAGLVEAWRERPEGRYLEKLAAQEVHLHEPGAAATELKELLGLIQRDALLRRLNDLLGRADKLAEAEKRELQSLQRKLAAARPGNPDRWRAASCLTIMVGLFGSAERNTLSEKIALIPEDRHSQLKLLIARGKEQGYLTYAEVNDHLPNEIVDPEQIEDIVNMINDMGITVYEKAPDSESLLMSETIVTDDEDATDEAAAALATVDSEFGRTTDPVRMYMREMGSVELLTREGEIRIAKRIEDGLNQVRHSLAMLPDTYVKLFEAYEPVLSGENRLADVLAGFAGDNIEPAAGSRARARRRRRRTTTTTRR